MLFQTGLVTPENCSHELQAIFFAKKPNMSKERGSWVYLFDPVIKRSILRLHSQ